MHHRNFYIYQTYTDIALVLLVTVDDYSACGYIATDITACGFQLRILRVHAPVGTLALL